MAAPRIFVSSTAYDLGLLRGQLRSTISSLGYEPVLSEYSDVLYDPRRDAQSSCLRELEGCDILVLVVGGRLGSQASSQTLELIDTNRAAEFASVDEILGTTKISITQAELLKAVELRLPIFTFVDQAVLHDHRTFEANRESGLAEQIRYGSISDPSRAEYIFRFISFLSAMNIANAIEPFSRIEDIELHLKRQWAALFQRLLSEQSDGNFQTRLLQDVSTRLDDLKAVLLSSAEEGAARDIAQGTINFRHMLSTLSGLPGSGMKQAIEAGLSWDETLESLGIEAVFQPPGPTGGPKARGAVLLMKDGTLLQSRVDFSRFEGFKHDWAGFMELNSSVRLGIFSVVEGDRPPISRFMSADRYEVTPDGQLKEISYPPTPYSPDEEPF